MYYDEFERGRITYKTASVIVKNDGLSHNVSEYEFIVLWQYGDNCTIMDSRVTPDIMFQAAEWCDNNLKDDWLIGCDTNGFQLEEDAVAFKLAWL